MGLFEHFPYTNFHDLNLDWILKTVKDLYHQVSNQEEWIEKHQEEYNELKSLYNAIINGDFPEKMYDSLYNWVVKNSKSIIGDIIKSAFFVLEDGYLVAYIPDSWDEITFGTTGLDDFPAGYDFGHLTLTY